MSEKLKAISTKFKEKSPDVDHAKEEVKVECLLCVLCVVDKGNSKITLFFIENND